ncbi:hypothetical protein ACFXG4_52185, partial [Nocardia sp. NPDC059246]|uniref:hypothetical protein n=1 Tax=Nocardia sp. NPDC059246 TaxID=3346789 RepID=UPI0036CAAC06
RCECDRIDHQTGQFVSYSSTTPTAAEADALNRVGSWPVIPRRLVVAGPIAPCARNAGRSMPRCSVTSHSALSSAARADPGRGCSRTMVSAQRISTWQTWSLRADPATGRGAPMTTWASLRSG